MQKLQILLFLTLKCWQKCNFAYTKIQIYGHSHPGKNPNAFTARWITPPDIRLRRLFRRGFWTQGEGLLMDVPLPKLFAKLYPSGITFSMLLPQVGEPLTCWVWYWPSDFSGFLFRSHNPGAWWQWRWKSPQHRWTVQAIPSARYWLCHSGQNYVFYTLYFSSFRRLINPLYCNGFAVLLQGKIFILIFWKNLTSFLTLSYRYPVDFSVVQLTISAHFFIPHNTNNLPLHPPGPAKFHKVLRLKNMKQSPPDTPNKGGGSDLLRLHLLIFSANFPVSRYCSQGIG